MQRVVDRRYGQTARMDSSTTLGDLFPRRRPTPRDPATQAAVRQMQSLRPASLIKGAATGVALYAITTAPNRARRRR